MSYPKAVYSAEFARRFPLIHVAVTVESSSAGTGLVARGEVEIGLTFNPPRQAQLSVTLARDLAQIEGLKPEAPETNLVFFDTEATGLTADEVAARARRHGVKLSTMGRYRVRACTHLDVAAAGIAEAVQVIRRVLAA